MLSASVLAFAVGVAPAGAQTVAALRAAAHLATAAATVAMPPPSPGGSAASTPGMASASVRALQYQARVAAGVSLAQQAQAAGRAAAQALTSNVPDGLGKGGLDPVSNPLAIDKDPTGLSTWQGADAPVQTTSNGATQVTVEQTDSRALLDWTTFNVGKDTTLVFDQKQNGVGQTSWVVLNRVVGQLDPNTGLRNPKLAPSPSQILGSIKADGTVLVLNQNGILFGGTSQVNVNSLGVTSLEIGRALDPASGTPLTIAQRNAEFLQFGLLGFADQASATDKPSAFTFSAQAIDATSNDPVTEGAVEVQAGAQIQSGQGGFLLFTGPKVTNAGHLISPLGQVTLQAGRQILLSRSEGSAASIDPNVRGFVATSQSRADAVGDYARNTASGWIEAAQGYVSLGATIDGASINEGLLQATTSVSRNGFIRLTGGDIQLAPSSTLSIAPDSSDATIPQDPTTLASFKASKIAIGDAGSRIEIAKDAMIYAPSANVQIGATPGPTTTDGTAVAGGPRIFVDTGAIIDVAGLTDVDIAASRNAIRISPVKKNETADTPTYKTSFLNGATIYVDPRVSGVREDGVAWIGSPLLDAASYYQQVGVTASELMTKGGNVSLGVTSAVFQHPRIAANVVVKAGADIDLSGGWVRYDAGVVRTSQLVTVSGGLVDVGSANPNDTYVAVYNGFTRTQARWGITQTWANPLMTGTRSEGAYTEGRDAGTLTLQASAAVLDGAVHGDAFAGPLQVLNAKAGGGKSGVYGDLRPVQAANGQLPAGGMLYIQALGLDSGGLVTGGADIKVVDQIDYRPIAKKVGYDQGVSIDAAGDLVIAAPGAKPAIPFTRLQTLTLSDAALSGMGLSEISLQTSGALDLAAGADVELDAGGVFNAVSGRTMTIDGSIAAASGSIRLQTLDAGIGSALHQPDQPGLGSFDVVVNGTLSTRGRWANDFNAAAGQLQGGAYINGGSVSITAAPRVTLVADAATIADTLSGAAPTTNVDISGSILINPGAKIDVSSGGYVRTNGSFDLSGKGGSVSLIDETAYFQLVSDPNQATAGGVPGFRVATNDPILNPGAFVPVNPDRINARVTIADGAILAHGFAGGGTFTLTTPEIGFGSGEAATGTLLPLDFFSESGFASFNITSYKTGLTANTFVRDDAFNNPVGLGGFNAFLQAQTLTVNSGETLSLTQSMFPSLFGDQQIAALRALHTGTDLNTVLTAAVPVDAWDRRAVNLTLGGLVELHVAAGGRIEGEAGSVLTASQVFNEGVIRLPGGTLRQSETLPQLYAGSLGLKDIQSIFTARRDGLINEGARNALGLTASDGHILTNGEIASQFALYQLADLEIGQGTKLAGGSVTDLSGVSIRNPRAKAVGQGVYTGAVDGKVVAGGLLDASATAPAGAGLFHTAIGLSPYDIHNPLSLLQGQALVADPGSTIDISGAADTFDRLAANGKYAPTAVWSDAGAVNLGARGTLTGAEIHAQAGAPQALGGTLSILDPVLYQSDPAAPTPGAVSADMLQQAGFDTLVAQGSLNSVGDVTLSLGHALFVTSRPRTDAVTLDDPISRDQLAPVIRSGGVLEIDAPYIGLDSQLQSVSTPDYGVAGDNTVVFKADAIDVSGAVLFDQSVHSVQLNATGDLRLSGVQPWEHVFGAANADAIPNTLQGQLAVNGNLRIVAGQVYPTTGSSFLVTSTARNGRIVFARRSADPIPASPYSAGGSLTVQAANIVQGGVVRTPLGALTLGSNTAMGAFAPATKTVSLEAGSVTSVSADGLSIPYGTTTDQIEWFFDPTNSAKLNAPPSGVLHIGGSSLDLGKGAAVDLSGGGDVYAYEFIPGTGGTRDELDRFNADPFTGNAGYQYPDQRQVYAIVPGLSSATVAAVDPIYSADYGDLYSASGVGRSVHLDGGPGVPAGWYTLLPAKYAMLPGGMRVVERTGAPPVAPGSSEQLNDGTVVVSGRYGSAAGGFQQSDVRSFDVQSQAVVLTYSDIALTSGNLQFAALAAHAGVVKPRLPIDAGRLVLAPVKALNLDAGFNTAAATGGRGAQADISGGAFDIVSTIPAAPGPAAPPASSPIVLTADSLTGLHASSLLIGGVRTDNSDGTTNLTVTASSITVDNDAAHPLSASETILAVDGSSASLSVKAGSAIAAAGPVDDSQSGDLIIDGSQGTMTAQGAVLRVSTGAQRELTRLNQDRAKTAKPGAIAVQRATITGASVLMDSTGDFNVNPSADIEAGRLALGAAQISFSAVEKGRFGLEITPELQALLAKAQELDLRATSTINFDNGHYAFNDLKLDAPGLTLEHTGRTVSIEAKTLTLADSGVAKGDCGGSGTLYCGSGSLSFTADQIVFGKGVVKTFGFGRSVSLTSSSGVFAEGQGGLDVGGAALAIQTPVIADRFTTPLVGQPAVIPSLTLASTGAVQISKAAGTTAAVADGSPGASLSISGRSIDVSGTTLRATAGAETL